MNHKLYNVGMYIRLSQDSKNYRGGEESSSIENQIAMLSQFINAMPGWVETRTYVDDGASGANFKRRGFQDMMEDVRRGIINLVLVKDLSRFGRNYLETGRLLEEELPALGCRFVALSDGIDTETGENDIIPFLNAINDFYIRDVSERIKSVMMAKAKDGQKLTACSPYGYERNPNDHTRLVVDEYAADVVRRIFALRIEGIGYTSIAGKLNKDDVLPPRLYYFKRQGRETKAVCTKAWTVRTVKLILSNEIYIGNTISMKRGTRSYRDKREYRRDESEWMRVENTHKPIIDIETWEKVQRINQMAKEMASNQREPQTSLFVGLVFCPDCGAKMGYTKSTSKLASGITVKYGAYICRTFEGSGRGACSSHRISENNLKLLVIGHIKEMADMLAIDEHGVLEKLRAKLISGYKNNKSDKLKQKQMLEQQLYALENQIDQLYEDKVAGIVSVETFGNLVDDIESRRVDVECNLKRLNPINNEKNEKANEMDRWASHIKEKATFEEVDRELLDCLIDKIEIGERIVQNGELTQDVRIFYKHVGLC